LARRGLWWRGHRSRWLEPVETGGDGAPAAAVIEKGAQEGRRDAMDA